VSAAILDDAGNFIAGESVLLVVGGKSLAVIAGYPLVPSENPQDPVSVFEDGADIVVGEPVFGGERGKMGAVVTEDSPRFAGKPQVPVPVFEQVVVAIGR